MPPILRAFQRNLAFDFGSTRNLKFPILRQDQSVVCQHIGGLSIKRRKGNEDHASATSRSAGKHGLRPYTRFHATNLTTSSLSRFDLVRFMARIPPAIASARWAPCHALCAMASNLPGCQHHGYSASGPSFPGCQRSAAPVCLRSVKGPKTVDENHSHCLAHLRLSAG